MNEQQTIRAIFEAGHTVAVVGLSPKAWRESFGVSRAMQAAGWRIIPIHPAAAARGESILGEKVYATLTDAALHETIDLVNVFRNSGGRTSRDARKPSPSAPQRSGCRWASGTTRPPPGPGMPA